MLISITSCQSASVILWSRIERCTPALLIKISARLPEGNLAWLLAQWLLVSLFFQTRINESLPGARHQSFERFDLSYPRGSAKIAQTFVDQIFHSRQPFWWLFKEFLASLIHGRI